MLVVALFALATLVPLVPFLVWLLRRGAYATPEEVAATLEAFADGSGGRYDWDDFVSVPLRDPALEATRLRCARLPEEFPPERPGQYCSDAGLDVVRACADALRHASGVRRSR